MADIVADIVYSEPSFYRMLFRERSHDIALYRKAAGSQSRKVLELGVGDGRVAFALAGDGHDVTGVDREPDMLAALEERRTEHSADVASRVETVLADVRELALDRRFSLVLAPFNGFAHFGELEDQRALFDAVERHLEHDARFVFDVMIPDPKLLSGGASSVARLEHPRTGAICRLEETYSYETMTQMLTVTTHLVERETSKEQTLTLSLRQWFPRETELVLTHFGFEILERVELGDSLAYFTRPS